MQPCRYSNVEKVGDNLQACPSIHSHVGHFTKDLDVRARKLPSGSEGLWSGSQVLEISEVMV